VPTAQGKYLTVYLIRNFKVNPPKTITFRCVASLVPIMSVTQSLTKSQLAPSAIQNVDFPAKEIEHTSENEIEHETQEEPPDFGDFYCSKCKFKTNSNKKLKQHIIRKHTEYNTSYPRNCELCQKSFENSLQLKKHLKEHSLKGTIFGHFLSTDTSLDFEKKITKV
jgi:hypothetical protein